MIKYAIYNQASGKILSRGVACPESVDEQLVFFDNSEFYLNCPADATHIINNEPVTIEYQPTLAELKESKRRQISDAFDRDMASGRVQSALGFAMDARRSATKNDLQNMEALAAHMSDSNETTAIITDADNIDHADISLEQVKTIISELQEFGLGLYAAKRARIAALKAALTPEEVENL